MFVDRSRPNKAEKLKKTQIIISSFDLKPLRWFAKVWGDNSPMTGSYSGIRSQLILNKAMKIAKSKPVGQRRRTNGSIIIDKIIIWFKHTGRSIYSPNNLKFSTIFRFHQVGNYKAISDSFRSRFDRNRVSNEWTLSNRLQSLSL